MRMKPLITGVIVLVSGIACAHADNPATGDYTVDVAFSDTLQKRMGSINNVERRLEEQFRDDRHYHRGISAAGTQRTAALDTTGAEWAGERLIENFDEFTLENLIRSMVVYNINRAMPDFRGRIEIELREIGLSNAPIAFMKRSRSYAAGRITVTHSNGDILFDSPVNANLVVNPVADRSYSGPELAFTEVDPPKRVGPTLAYFIERALENVWPDHKDEIVGPVVIQVAGPNARVAQRRVNRS